VKEISHKQELIRWIMQSCASCRHLRGQGRIIGCPSEGSGQNHRLPPDNRKMPKKESKDMAERARENGGEK